MTDINKITINNTISEISLVHKEFKEFGNETLHKKVINELCIVIDEVLSNIILHGFKHNTPHLIHVNWMVEGDYLIMQFFDQGKPFNPLLLQKPVLTNSLDNRPIGGLGVHLMKNLVDDISYERTNDHNLLMIKKIVR